MPRKTIKVEIPIKSPTKMEILVDAILAEHTAQGIGSPLASLDMAGLATLIATEKAKRLEGQNYHSAAQAATQLANAALGIAEEQNVNTEGTIYYYLARFRDILLVKYENSEESISKFGYNVVIDKVNGRKTIRVDIPIKKPYEIEHLCDILIARDTELGIDSPLDDTEVADLVAKLSTEKSQRIVAKKAHDSGQSAIEEADRALGVNPEQNAKTSGTILNTVTRARDLLLIEYQNLEEQLSIWGFNVVIGQAHMPGYTETITREFTINAASQYFFPIETPAPDTIIRVSNTGAPAITANLAISETDDPESWVIVSIPANVTREFLMSDLEIGDYTTAHFLRLANPDPALDAQCSVGIITQSA